MSILTLNKYHDEQCFVYVLSGNNLKKYHGQIVHKNSQSQTVLVNDLAERIVVPLDHKTLYLEGKRLFFVANGQAFSFDPESPDSPEKYPCPEVVRQAFKEELLTTLSDKIEVSSDKKTNFPSILVVLGVAVILVIGLILLLVFCGTEGA